MKNLKLVFQLAANLDLRLGSEGEVLRLSAFDVERGRVFFASSASFVYGVQLPVYQKGTLTDRSFCSLDVEEIDLEPGDVITAMDYLMEKESLLVGSSSGCLLLYNVEEKTTELVGRVEGGVKSISCSPDGALVAIKSGSGQLLVMTLDWELLYELDVGATYTENAAKDVNESSTSLHSISPVIWRGDGKYFATLGGVECAPSLQKLMVFESESGNLHSSEPKDFKGSSVDWMPSGAKIASACCPSADGSCPTVVFFEKNGLERSSFSIAEPAGVVEYLKWNCNSELLATSISCGSYDAIKIWYCNNNHWYLKQDLRFSMDEGVKFCWDPTKPQHLICWTQHGKVISHVFSWNTAVTETSISLVIDGPTVLLTPLNFCLMPPPFSLFKLKFHCAVNSLSFLPKSSPSRLAAVLSDGSLCVLELPDTAIWDQFEDHEINVESVHSGFSLGGFMHLTWIDMHVLIGISCRNADRNDSCFVLTEIELQCSEDSSPVLVNSSGWQANISRELPIEGPIMSMARNPAKRGSAFVELSTGSVTEYLSNTSALTVSMGSKISNHIVEYGFPSRCSWMTAVACHDKDMIKPLLFGLDENGRLYMGKMTLSSCCTSYAFYASDSGLVEQVVTHLIFTTKQDHLYIVDVSEILDGTLDLKFDSNVADNSRNQKNKDHVVVWEKGSELIGVLHGDEAAVILQTNRGNLECIFPRKLVLVSIVNALAKNRFGDALGMVRRHRIDFNIIVDYCGLTKFVDSARELVKQVKNLSHITEFVCAIRNENVVSKLYMNYVTVADLDETSVENKVSPVLRSIRQALEEHVEESPSRELCILTTLARSSPPLLEDALKRIKVIRELELRGADDSRRKLYPSAEESLKHLLWLTDPGSVFDVALGLYDLNLAAIVALNSQKDPKEFLPILKRLECLPSAVMRYQIDLKLHRYESALKNIASAGEQHYDACMELLGNHPELFPVGIQLFAEKDKKMQVLEAWGDHLFGEKCFADAATTYLSCSLYQKSLKAYRAGGNWRGVFTVAGLLDMEADKIRQLAHELCEEFAAMGKPAEAAEIALYYCADVDRGVGYYVMARKWEDALQVAYMYNRKDLVATVKDAALECAASLISEFQEGLEKVGKYAARYLAVRQRRLLLAAKLQSDGELIDREDDNVSEASTSYSEMSAYTTRSLKASSVSVTSTNINKVRGARQQRKKGGKIRAGSPGEEMALVEHLKGMALSTGSQQELKSLLIVLVSLGEEGNARALQRAGFNFEISQQAAVKIADDTLMSVIMDENSQTLEHYIKMLKQLPNVEAAWQLKVLSTPQAC